jgi:Icc-related predicted phosphoesterase
MRLFRRPAGIRLFFATDVHGSDRCFRKWVHAAAAYRVDVLVLGGDVTGKAVAPIVENDGGWTGVADGRRVHARGEEELAELRRRLRDAGHYDVVMSDAEAECLETDAGALDRLFWVAAKQRLSEWVELVDERLQNSQIRGFTMLGNDDPEWLADVLRGSTAVVYAEDRICELPGGYEMVSYGYSTPTPWATPRELTEAEIEKQLESLARGLKDPSKAIFNLHCPPRDTHLDQAPQLDEDLRMKAGLGGQSMGSVGSQAVRDLIARLQPMLGLHGHVHESAGVEKIGRTLCINPGSEYSEGILRGAVVQLGEKGVASWQLVQG